MDVRYPVVVDNDYAVWQAFDNHYWPALYFVDAQGRIRHHHFGEGEYEQSEMVLQMLLREAGRRRRTGPRAHRAPRCRGGGRLGQPGIAGDLRRLRTRRGLRLARRPAARRAPHLLCAGRVASQPVGAVRGLADRPGACAAQRARRFHLVPVPRSGPAPRDGSSEQGGRPCASRSASTASPRGRPTASTPTSAATAPPTTSGCTS